jgi:transcriptional regulator with GAF, ATPase, and Fis domain
MRADSLSVRILAATSRDLAQMLKDGGFRMDLYCSLSLVNLKIPPLRRRPEDIAFLAQRFLEKVSQFDWSCSYFTARNVTSARDL